MIAFLAIQIFIYKPCNLHLLDFALVTKIKSMGDIALCHRGSFLPNSFHLDSSVLLDLAVQVGRVKGTHLNKAHRI